MTLYSTSFTIALEMGIGKCGDVPDQYMWAWIILMSAGEILQSWHPVSASCCPASQCLQSGRSFLYERLWLLLLSVLQNSVCALGVVGWSVMYLLLLWHWCYTSSCPVTWPLCRPSISGFDLFTFQNYIILLCDLVWSMWSALTLRWVVLALVSGTANLFSCLQEEHLFFLKVELC